ncbi:MAG: tRNA lysidine(34) synthetase TilS [Terriglobales bacterium]
MYHESVVEEVLEYIRERALLRAGDRVGVAVSGGADSVALLRLLLGLRGELGVVLSVLHFNHRIRGAEADADRDFVRALAESYDLPFYEGAGDTSQYSRQQGVGLEAAGRALRYQWFWSLLRAGRVDRVATAHTLDDQAETVLLRLLRGAGTRGLAGIYPEMAAPAAGGSKSATKGRIVRPLLAARRGALRKYLEKLGQTWREDASNLDPAHARNRLRLKLMPLLEQEFNPAVARVLAGTAEIARAEEEFWREAVASLLPQLEVREVAGGAAAGLSFRAAALCELPPALQRRLVRALAESVGLRLSLEQVEGVRALAGGRGRVAELPGEWQATRAGGLVRFEKRTPRPAGAGRNQPSGKYEYRLSVPGEVRVQELGSVICASIQKPDAGGAGYNAARFLDLRSLGSELVVRNWRAGDRFWPAHAKSPKKVKALLQERRVVEPERGLWPVVASGAAIVWMRGFPPPREYLAGPTSRRALVIEERTPEGRLAEDPPQTPASRMAK